jgi:hypothetical protein
MFLSYHGFKFSQKILVAAKLFHICKNLIETVDCSYESCVSFEFYKRFKEGHIDVSSIVS